MSDEPKLISAAEVLHDILETGIEATDAQVSAIWDAVDAALHAAYARGKAGLPPSDGVFTSVEWTTKEREMRVTHLFPFGVYDTIAHIMHYIGLHEDEADVWRTFLGWPDAEEIEERKRLGLKVVPLTVTRK